MVSGFFKKIIPVLLSIWALLAITVYLKTFVFSRILGVFAK